MRPRMKIRNVIIVLAFPCIYSCVNSQENQYEFGTYIKTDNNDELSIYLQSDEVIFPTVLLAMKAVQITPQILLHIQAFLNLSKEFPNSFHFVLLVDNCDIGNAIESRWNTTVFIANRRSISRYLGDRLLAYVVIDVDVQVLINYSGDRYKLELVLRRIQSAHNTEESTGGSVLK